MTCSSQLKLILFKKFFNHSYLARVTFGLGDTLARLEAELVFRENILENTLSDLRDFEFTSNSCLEVPFNSSLSSICSLNSSFVGYVF